MEAGRERSCLWRDVLRRPTMNRRIGIPPTRIGAKENGRRLALDPTARVFQANAGLRGQGMHTLSRIAGANQSWADAVNRFRPRRPGPEESIEDAVVESLSTLLTTDCHQLWIAAQYQIGAGLPDLTIASFEPELLRFSTPPELAVQVLAYLRVVGKAKPATIAGRLRQPKDSILDVLTELACAGAVEPTIAAFSLAPPWRAILPEVITIEAKVDNWRRALHQAARNCLFSHRSYIAVPFHIAHRVRPLAEAALRRIGILGVDSQGRMHVIREARRQPPRLWAYYYQVALAVATASTEHADGVSCIVDRREGGIH